MAAFTTVAEIMSREGKTDEVKQRLMALLSPVRAEQGCISFDLHVSHENPNMFVLIAVWESYSLWVKHINSPLQKALLEESKTEHARELILDWKSYGVDKVS